ncbi:hypothetical protein Mgra_00008086 [Meloidogyne graminicola]|uniref:CRAL-TRIO domain-containing protein n=1 Tax=Meloidogyne graminicola TaxID=189291 RepID=A0A8S9ZGS5_9BILA|nr:hypothetical protein Mgra_00008086 [Meloidogyne graminicola]
MIIYLSFKHLLPEIIFLLIPLLCKGMFSNRQHHHQQHQEQLIQHIKNFEENVKKLFEHVVEFKEDTIEQLKNFKTPEKILIREKIFDFVSNLQKYPIILSSEINELNFKIETNPFIEDNIKKLENEIKQFFVNNISIPKESIKYKSLFEIINLFWSDKAETENVDLNEQSTSHHKENIQAQVSSKDLGERLGWETFTEENIIGASSSSHHLLINSISGENNKIYIEFVKLRKTINKFLHKIKLELILGINLNFNENVEMNGKLHELYTKTSYFTLKLNEAESKTIELEDLKEFKNNGYGGYGVELKPLRIFEAERLEKLEKIKENADIEITIYLIEKILPRKIVYSNKNLMKEAIDYLIEFYSEIEQLPIKIFNNIYEQNNENFDLWNTHNNLLKASQNEHYTEKKLLEELNNSPKIFDQLEQRLISWSLAEFWLKDSIKKVAEYLKKFNNDSDKQLFLLAENIEKNLELPLNYLNNEYENFKYAKVRNENIYSNEMNILHLSVLIRINAAKVLLAYTRMKKIFKIFDSINILEYKQITEEMAINYSLTFDEPPKYFRLKTKNIPKGYVLHDINNPGPSNRN